METFNYWNFPGRSEPLLAIFKRCHNRRNNISAIKALYGLNITSCFLEVLFFGNCDFVKNSFFLNLATLYMSSHKEKRMSFIRTASLSSIVNIMFYWIKQYYIYYYQNFIAAVNKNKKTLRAHWGVTDGANYRDLQVLHGSITLSPPNNRFRGKVQILYIPLIDLGVLGTGRLDEEIELPANYQLVTNNCQLYGMKICCQSGYPIFRLVDYHSLLCCVITTLMYWSFTDFIDL